MRLTGQDKAEIAHLMIMYFGCESFLMFGSAENRDLASALRKRGCRKVHEGFSFLSKKGTASLGLETDQIESTLLVAPCDMKLSPEMLAEIARVTRNIFVLVSTEAQVPLDLGEGWVYSSFLSSALRGLLPRLQVAVFGTPEFSQARPLLFEKEG
jgi:hypothetical protein